MRELSRPAGAWSWKPGRRRALFQKEMPVQRVDGGWSVEWACLFPQSWVHCFDPYLCGLTTPCSQVLGVASDMVAAGGSLPGSWELTSHGCGQRCPGPSPVTDRRPQGCLGCTFPAKGQGMVALGCTGVSSCPFQIQSLPLNYRVWLPVFKHLHVGQPGVSEAWGL